MSTNKKFLKIHSLKVLSGNVNYGSRAKWFASLKKIFNSNLKVSKKNLFNENSCKKQVYKLHINT